MYTPQTGHHQRQLVLPSVGDAICKKLTRIDASALIETTKSDRTMIYTIYTLLPLWKFLPCFQGKRIARTENDPVSVSISIYKS
ncbi:hypothetical protein [Nonlabens xiamenensis]|uniref:hypothetical protein n=1 Tax=Nonlabens xiamenensis TaxID=2341043 RepID=UPI000F605ADA|nr:hypothetical protein [Nonlabens xiamenensis]